MLCYEQFLLFPQCFQQVCFPGALKGFIVWEWVKGGYLDFSHLTELEKNNITKIYMKKKTSIIKNRKIRKKKKKDDRVPLKGYLTF